MTGDPARRRALTRTSGRVPLPRVNRLAAAAALALAVVAIPQVGEAHAIAGNRFFPGTTMFDDPGVADEFQVIYEDVRTPVGGEPVTDHIANVGFARMLTDKIAVGVDSGFIQRSWGRVKETGATGVSLNIKAMLYRDNLNETLVATSLTYSIPNSGSERVGARTPSSLQPALFFGQGLGNLPDSMAWLRPFGFVGAAALEFPMRGSSESLDYGGGRTVGVKVRDRNPVILHTGFALEYSTLYLTDRFVHGKLPEQEPVYQVVPLVEVAFDTPQRGKARGTVNPGIAYIHGEWQLSAEAAVPLSSSAGRRTGFRLQFLVFLDQLVPGFAEPMLGH